MNKGVVLTQGQVVVLSLDGTLVYVESVERTFAAVVALPEQLTERSDDRVFMPGRVGAKKISPFSQPDRIVSVDQLSERNRNFIGTYEQLRQQHGPNYVDRTPEEAAAHAAANAPKPTKAEKAAARQAEKTARKASAGPRYLQRCTVCHEQPAHPNHGVHNGGHAFVAPTPPVVKCAACDELESADVHGKPPPHGHRFIAGKPERAPKPPKAAPVPKTGRPAKVGLPDAAFRWTGTDDALHLLGAANAKYKEGNSGRAIAEVVKAAGEAGAALADVAGVLAQHPRWTSMSVDRIKVALEQLHTAGLIVPVS